MQLIVTSAGRAALVNAENTGTNTVRVAAIGIGSSGFTAKPDGSDTSLPGEVKRLTTFAGLVVAADTLHVTIRDDSSDVYSMRGIGLYLEDGTLFALYGQAGVILEKAAQAMMLMSADVVFTQVQATSLTFGDANFINPPATTEVQGVVELATDAEAIAGNDAQRALTPRASKASLDARLGANAPTPFARNLLAVSTAAAMRSALELKGAALKDEGAGKGLDADLLDGKHGDHYLQWSNLVGAPATFPPATHAHAWSDIQGKPATFPPTAHGHVTADITGLDAALAARPLKGSNGTWPDVVPTAADLFEAPAALRAFTPETTNAPGSYGVAAAWSTNGKFDKVNGIGIHQLAFSSDRRLFWSQSQNGQQFNAWDELWTTRNFDPASRVKKSGDSMTGTLSTTELRVSAPATASGYSAVNLYNGGTIFQCGADNPYYGAFSVNVGAVNDVPVNIVQNNKMVIQLLSGGYIRACGSPWDNLDQYHALAVHGGMASTGSAAAFVLHERENNVNQMHTYYSQGLYRIWSSLANRDVLQITPNGAVTSPGGFDTASSRKLKQIDGPMPYGLAEIERLQTVAGRYRHEYNADGRKRLFFVAEQMAEVIPEAVTSDGVEFRGERVASIKMEQLLPVIVKSIQELASLRREDQESLTKMRATIAALQFELRAMRGEA